jgi:hypothetical protein
MDFSNIQLLDKGTTRKASGPINRDAGFDVRYTTYTKNTKNGAEKISQFVFTKVGLSKTKLGELELSGAGFHDKVNGIVGIAVVPAGKGNFMNVPKRSKNGKKSASVTVPSLVASLTAEGLINPEFEGSQHFELVELGADANATYFQLVKSATIADKAYEPGDETSAVDEENKSADETNGQEN